MAVEFMRALQRGDVSGVAATIGTGVIALRRIHSAPADIAAAVLQERQGPRIITSHH